jgi:hypothetical protein
MHNKGYKSSSKDSFFRIFGIGEIGAEFKRNAVGVGCKEKRFGVFFLLDRLPTKRMNTTDFITQGTTIATDITSIVAASAACATTLMQIWHSFKAGHFNQPFTSNCCSTINHEPTVEHKHQHGSKHADKDVSSKSAKNSLKPEVVTTPPPSAPMSGSHD